jgi:chromosome segregation ATPase
MPHDTINEKEEFERLAADDIGSLSIELEEEQNLRASLEEKLLGLEESHNLNLSKLTKERDHALAMVKLLKKEKVEFDVGHNDFREKFEKLEEAYKVLESKFSSLTKIREQLQIQLTIEQSKVPPMQVIEVPCSSNPICDRSNIIEENIRLKADLAKGLATCIQGEKNLNDLLSNQ